MLKRKILAVFTALLTVSAVLPQLISAAAISLYNEYILTGDLNGDGTVSGDDAMLLRNYLLGAPYSLDVNGQKFDINGDDSADSFDLVMLRKLLTSQPEFTAEDYSFIMINEVCSSNKNSIKDAAGASPDWVEIYNSSDKDIPLDGCGVSDGNKNKFKFSFPENTVIPAGGYVLVFCDDAVNQAEGEYHAAFKISASGETIYLTHPEFGEIDAVSVPALETDVAYGRYVNASDNFTYLTPTPGKSNDSAENLAVIEKPVFSAEGGFYDSAFSLTLSDENGNTVYYTTDGSDPRTSSTAKVYTGGISIYNNTNNSNVYSAFSDISLYGYTPPSYKIDKGIVVRAVSKDENGNFSAVSTNNYFVGKTAAYYKDLKVVSLAADSDSLFSSENGIYMVGDGYYSWKNSSEYVKYEPGDTQNRTNYNKDGKEAEIPAAVQVFENGKLAYSSDVGVRIAGNWSRAYPQKSLRLYARSEYGDSKMKYEFIEGLTDINGKIIDSYDKITLRNSGGDNQYLHFRDALIQDLMSERNVDVQAAEPCIVFMDGEFWGFYFLREKLEAEYIESHYGIDKDNVTTIKCGEIEGSEAIADEYREFAEWAAAADMTDEANYQRVCETYDMQSFMDYIAMETYICNNDWSNASYTNNWQMWRTDTVVEGNPFGDGKWRFMVYDTDNSTGIWNSESTIYTYDSLNSMYKGYGAYNFSRVFYNLLNNETFRREFYDTYIDIMENTFAPSRVSEKLDEYISAYRSAVIASNLRFGNDWSNYNFDDEVSVFRNFFNNRPKYAKYYLDALMGTIDDNSENMLSNTALWTYYGSASFSADSVENVFTVRTSSVCAQDWDIQAQVKNLTVEKGKTYMLTFEASCTADTEMGIGIIHQVGTSYPGCWYSNAALTPELQEYSYTFTMAEDTASDWFLYFNFGSKAGDYVIRNAKLIEVKEEKENLLSDASGWNFYNTSADNIMTVKSYDSLSVSVPTIPEEFWQAQAFYPGIHLESGKSYTLTYSADASVTSDIRSHIQQNYGDYYQYAEQWDAVSADARTFSYTFTADESTDDGSVCFDFGSAVGEYSVYDISLVCNN